MEWMGSRVGPDGVQTKEWMGSKIEPDGHQMEDGDQEGRWRVIGQVKNKVGPDGGEGAQMCRVSRWSCTVEA